MQERSLLKKAGLSGKWKNKNKHKHKHKHKHKLLKNKVGCFVAEDRK